MNELSKILIEFITNRSKKMKKEINEYISENVMDDLYVIYNIVQNNYQHNIENAISEIEQTNTEKCDDIFPFHVIDHLIENSWNVIKAQPIACGWV